MCAIYFENNNGRVTCILPYITVQSEESSDLRSSVPRSYTGIFQIQRLVDCDVSHASSIIGAKFDVTHPKFTFKLF